MKDNIKKLVKGMIGIARTLFYRRFYRKQLKREFVKPTDILPEGYRKDIDRYWHDLGVRIKTGWHRWYSSRNGNRDVRYVPEDLYYCRIEPALNRQEFSVPLADKSILDLMMPDFKRPVVIIRNANGIFLDTDYGIITREEAINACMGRGEIVFKPTIYSGGGRSIRFVESDDAGEVSDFFEKYGKDFIVQEPVVQHEELAKLNPDSVNTVKIMSFLNNNGVEIVSTIVRAGIAGQRVDNLTNGGNSVGVDENGYFRNMVFDKYGNVSDSFPNGHAPGGRRVPGYRKAVERVKRAHPKLGQFRLVSWDIAIDPEETPILIEYNPFYQGINMQQLCNGPLFGDLTDEVLEFVFGG